MQIASQPYAQERILDVTAWCEQILAFQASPSSASEPSRDHSAP